jgi:hypothetical protein
MSPAQSPTSPQTGSPRLHPPTSTCVRARARGGTAPGGGGAARGPRDSTRTIHLVCGRMWHSTLIQASGLRIASTFPKSSSPCFRQRAPTRRASSPPPGEGDREQTSAPALTRSPQLSSARKRADADAHGGRDPKLSARVARRQNLRLVLVRRRAQVIPLLLALPLSCSHPSLWSLCRMMTTHGVPP